MSFILDALKKSETDRQRQAGPALYEMRIAPPRSRFPLWAMVVAALLAVNVLVVSGWLWTRAARGAPSTANTVATATLAAVPLSVPAQLAPVAAVAPVAPAGSAAPAGAATTAAVASAPRDPELAVLDSSDNDAAVEMPSTERRGAAMARASNEDLPTRDELHSRAIAALPELRLDLHVYDPNPMKRFVLINMHRLREADTSPEGVRVDRITAEGAELEYQGTRFFLAHE